MRPSHLVSLALVLPLASPLLACSGGPKESATSATDSDTDTDTGSGTETGTTTTSGGTTTTSGSSSSSGSSTGGACTPGMEIQCACPDGGTATQTCNPDGNSFGPCGCPMGTTTTSTTDPTTSTTDPSTTDGTTTDGTTTDGTTTGDGACVDLIEFEMAPSEATLSGAWMLAMSMLGEGEIANNQMGGMGTILYEPEIPCDDTWYIWARIFDDGADDSYFATLDGEPDPAPIFEGDCSGQGNSYKWARLNWRDPMAGPCEYVMDPWAPMWTAGTHQIEFSYRESPAMGRILLTNDPDLVPN